MNKLPVGVALSLPPPAPHHCPDPAVFAREVERLGFESFWAQEHTICPVTSASKGNHNNTGADVAGYLDPLTALARASAVTRRIKLGTSVLLAAQHHPVHLAKQVATLDHYSGGRLLLGIGGGWNREEAEMLGANFDRRWSQIREGVGVMRELWGKETGEYHGEFYDLPPSQCFPRPAQQPGPPVLLGGKAANVLRRVALWGDGWLPNFVTPEEVRAARATVDEMAWKAGRDPRAIQFTLYSESHDPERIQALLAAGGVRVVVRPPVVTSEAQAVEALGTLARRIFG